ncbi:MAG: ABC transporter ATP-binding protein [bacterium]|nr:ABC transporter ATP-binding protein [bacterium]
MNVDAITVDRIEASEHPVILADSVSIDYRIKKRWLNVIHGVTLSLKPMEIHGLVGESGSGKSTLALALMRYMAANARISDGRILFNGEDLLTRSDEEMRRLWGTQMNLVPQDPLAALNPSYTIGNQMTELIRKNGHSEARHATERAVDMLRQVKIADPEIIVERYPHQLSGGMRQRVMIAMALSTHPRLLVLDEPTTALDVTTQAVILDLFRELVRDTTTNPNGGAALYVSHDLGTVAQLCDTVTVLYAGEVMESAPVVSLYKKPLHPYTAGLLASLPRHIEGTETRLPTIEGVAPSLAERPNACVFSARCPVALPHCKAEKPPLDLTPDGRMVRCWRWAEIATGTLSLQTEPTRQELPEVIEGTAESIDYAHVLKAQHMSKTFREPSLFGRLLRRSDEGVHAVDDVSLKVNARSTFGLVGESGSGKTTLARLIVALEQADSGEIELVGMKISRDLRRRPKEALRELRMIFQNPDSALNPYMTVGQSLGRPLRVLEEGRISQADLDARVADLLSAVRLPTDYADRYPSELSGGEKQRVAIARAFAINPALVVADEPTSSLDVSVQAVVLNLLKDLRAARGASYLLISHDLDVVSYLADWIAVMYLGQIVEEGTTADVYGIPSHPYTEALISAIPVPDPTVKGKPIRLEGEVPSARHIPTGCRFHTRCPRKIGTICEQQEPSWQDAGDGHRIRCHIPLDELVVLQSQTQPQRETP